MPRVFKTAEEIIAEMQEARIMRLSYGSPSEIGRDRGGPWSCVDCKGVSEEMLWNGGRRHIHRCPRVKPQTQADVERIYDAYDRRDPVVNGCFSWGGLIP